MVKHGTNGWRYFPSVSAISQAAVLIKHWKVILQAVLISGLQVATICQSSLKDIWFMRSYMKTKLGLYSWSPNSIHISMLVVQLEFQEKGD